MNTYGRKLRVSIIGESHGHLVGVVLDGVPPGIALTEKDFLPDLSRRKPGARGTTPRKESDLPFLATGVFNGFTTGAPLTIHFENKNVRSRDYDKLRETPRPGHADFVAHKKYDGYNDYRGGGHFSGRLTLGLVSAGVIAKKIVPEMNFNAKLVEAGGTKDIDVAISRALEDHDSIGGVVECRVSGVPVGLGEPFFDSIESSIAHLVFAIPAMKGVEFGSGFKAAQMRGSEHNDVYIDEAGTTSSNNAGGINGGITNGNEIIFRVAVKPTSSISRNQKTINLKSKKIENVQVTGRHDACIALRVPVVLEAVAAIALADFKLISA